MKVPNENEHYEEDKGANLAAPHFLYLKEPPELQVRKRMYDKESQPRLQVYLEATRTFIKQ